jgi:hypothetical protein
MLVLSLGMEVVGVSALVTTFPNISMYITDWKLCLLDTSCNVTEDEVFFQSADSLLSDDFRSPERKDGTWREKVVGKQDGSYSSIGAPMDIYSLGKMIGDIYSGFPQISCPGSLTRSLKNMLASDVKRRPSVDAVLRLDCFTSEQISIMTIIGELQLKQPSERLSTFTSLAQRSDVISRAVCSFKLLPSLAHSLQEAVSGFQVQEARKMCREVKRVVEYYLVSL